MTVQDPLPPRALPAPVRGLADEPPDSGPRIPAHGAEPSLALPDARPDTVVNALPWFLQALPLDAEPVEPEIVDAFIPAESGVYPTAATLPPPTGTQIGSASPDDWLDDPEAEDWEAIVDQIADEEERRFEGHGTDPMHPGALEEEIDAWAGMCARLERAVLAVDRSSDEAGALCDLAEARMSLEAPRGAETDATRAIERAPSRERGYVVRSRARLLLGDLAGALEDCDRALAHHPRGVASLAQKARVLSTVGDHLRAVAALDLCIALDPGNTEHFKHRARARALAGDLRGGCEDATIAVAMSPHDGDALLLRGLLRKAAGEPGASSDVRRALLSR